MRIGSLFSGIGGLELGLEWAGVGHTVFQVERDPYAQSILARHWPDAVRFDDVCTVGAHDLPSVDVLCGGYPCQDVSAAGRGEGLAGARSGLWFQFARIVGELRPAFVVVENVASGARRWLPQVRADLRGLGYHTRAYRVAAADVGAGHLRGRIFVVAYLDGEGERQPQGAVAEERGRARNGGAGDDGADPHGPRLPQRQGVGSHACEAEREAAKRDRRERTVGPGDDRQPQPALVRAVHGLPDWVDRRFPAALDADQFEWEPPRLKVRDRGGNEGKQVSALGNAVVPQVAYVVGRIVMQIAESVTP